MGNKETIKVFEDRTIRSLWDDETEEWYFTIVDVVAVLTDSVNPTAYWRKLKERLKKEGNQTVTDCHALHTCFMQSNTGFPRRSVGTSTNTRSEGMILSNKLNLTNQIDDRALFMKGIDVSYFYEGYSEFKTVEL